MELVLRLLHDRHINHLCTVLVIIDVVEGRDAGDCLFDALGCASVHDFYSVPLDEIH